jgi:hypothetical protein
VAREDKNRGKTVARCLTGLVNAFLWRSCSDKRVFELNEAFPRVRQVEAACLKADAAGIIFALLTYTLPQ